MSTLENIFKQWNKNSEKKELASQKIELASKRIELKILDEIKKAEGDATKLVNKAYGDAEKVEKLFQSVNASNKKIKSDVDSIYENTRKIYQDARDAAKDLGLDVPKEWNIAMDNLNFQSNNVPISNKGNIFPT